MDKVILLTYKNSPKRHRVKERWTLPESIRQSSPGGRVHTIKELLRITSTNAYNPINSKSFVSTDPTFMSVQHLENTSKQQEELLQWERTTGAGAPQDMKCIRNHQKSRKNHNDLEQASASSSASGQDSLHGKGKEILI